MSIQILPPSKTRFDYKALGLGFPKPKDPFVYNYNPTGSRLIKPGSDGFMPGDNPVSVTYTTRAPMRPELVRVLHSGRNSLATYGSKTGI